MRKSLHFVLVVCLYEREVTSFSLCIQSDSSLLGADCSLEPVQKAEPSFLVGTGRKPQVSGGFYHIRASVCQAATTATAAAATCYLLADGAVVAVTWGENCGHCERHVVAVSTHID